MTAGTKLILMDPVSARDLSRLARVPGPRAGGCHA